MRTIATSNAINEIDDTEVEAPIPVLSNSYITGGGKLPERASVSKNAPCGVMVAVGSDSIEMMENALNGPYVESTRMTRQKGEKTHRDFDHYLR